LVRIYADLGRSEKKTATHSERAFPCLPAFVLYIGVCLSYPACVDTTYVRQTRFPFPLRHFHPIPTSRRGARARPAAGTAAADALFVHIASALSTCSHSVQLTSLIGFHPQQPSFIVLLPHHALHTCAILLVLDIDDEVRGWRRLEAKHAVPGHVLDLQVTFRVASNNTDTWHTSRSVPFVIRSLYKTDCQRSLLLARRITSTYPSQSALLTNTLLVASITCGNTP